MLGGAASSYWILGPGSKVDLSEQGEIGVVATTPSSTTSPTPTVSVSPEVTTAPTRETPSAPVSTAAPVNKGVRTVIYHTTASSAPASRAATRAKELGWNVVQVAQWQGTVPSPTLFYSTGLQAEANALARDLGIGRVAPNHSGISLQGLSVVLRS